MATHSPVASGVVRETGRAVSRPDCACRFRMSAHDCLTGCLSVLT